MAGGHAQGAVVARLKLWHDLRDGRGRRIGFVAVVARIVAVRGESASPAVPNRGMITATIICACVMQGLDTTIVNVALPHIQGSMSAAQDQISWVLTSYIVASAIMMPLTGWLAARFGVKYIFLASVIGFTFASALCGAATSLAQLVLFRLLQGVF
ncbi:MAG: MFS transporter, partial [Stellaceae bacterium]